MTLLFMKLTIFCLLQRTLFTKFYNIIDEENFKIKVEKEFGYPINCSIIMTGLVMQRLVENIFLVCLKYSIPSNHDFYLDTNLDKEFQLVLESLHISQIIAEKEKNYDFMNEFAKLMDHNNDKTVEQIFKKFNCKFIIFGEQVSNNKENYNENKRIINLPLDLEKDLYKKIANGKVYEYYYSFVKYIPGTDKTIRSLEDDEEYFIGLKINVQHEELFNKEKPSISFLSFRFSQNFKSKEGYQHIIIKHFGLNFEFQKKLIKILSDMKNNGEGKEFFRFPTKNEKKEILIQLENLSEYSNINLNMKTEEEIEGNNYVEKDNYGIEGIKDEIKNKEKRGIKFYFILLGLILFFVIIFGIVLKFYVLKKYFIKL